MGFFDFLKEKEVPRTEKVSFSDLDKWVFRKKEDSVKREREVINMLKYRISGLVSELEKEISVLEGLDLSEKKVEEKLKLVSKENLGNYILHLRNLIEKLNGLEDKSILEFVKAKDLAFSNFEVASSTSFHKATIIIGKEIEAVKDSLGKFLKEFRETLNENKSFIESLQIISKVEERLLQMGDARKANAELDENVERLEDEVNSLKEEMSELRDKIREFRKSEQYEQKQRKEAELINKRGELEDLMRSFRAMIDFKALAERYHYFEDKMEVIKNYKDNFKEAFKDDLGQGLLELFEEPNKTKISEAVNKIILKQKEVGSFVIPKGKDEDFEEQIEAAKIRILGLEDEIVREKKRESKFSDNLNEVKNLLRKDLEKIGVFVE